jgi:hypothetical protein
MADRWSACVIFITDLINDLSDPPCIHFSQQEDTMSDKFIHATNDVTTALTLDELDVVTGGADDHVRSNFTMAILSGLVDGCLKATNENGKCFKIYNPWAS